MKMDESQPLTDEEIREFHKTYKQFDYDDNGTISTDNLGTVMRALGVNPSDSEVQDIINEIDVEGLYVGVNPSDSEVQDIINEIDVEGLYLGVNPSDSEVQDIINEIDVEGNGVIEFPEFLTVMSRKINEIDNEEEIREAINVIFKDRDSVSAVEVWYIMRKFGDKLSDEEVNDMIQQAKTDDGKIKYEDFLRIMGVRAKPD